MFAFFVVDAALPGEGTFPNQRAFYCEPVHVTRGGNPLLDTTLRQLRWAWIIMNLGRQIVFRLAFALFLATSQILCWILLLLLLIGNFSEHGR